MYFVWNGALYCTGIDWNKETWLLMVRNTGIKQQTGHDHFFPQLLPIHLWSSHSTLNCRHPQRRDATQKINNLWGLEIRSVCTRTQFGAAALMRVITNSEFLKRGACPFPTPQRAGSIYGESKATGTCRGEPNQQRCANALTLQQYQLSLKWDLTVCQEVATGSIDWAQLSRLITWGPVSGTPF
jgi:hypothetical protein